MICALLAACDTYAFLTSLLEVANRDLGVGARCPSDMARNRLASLKKEMRYSMLPVWSEPSLLLYDVTNDLFDFEEKINTILFNRGPR